MGDLHSGALIVTNSGAGTDTTKTRASRRVLPVPSILLPYLTELAGDRPKTAWLFASPRKPAAPIGDTYPRATLTRAVGIASQGQHDPIKRITVHGLRHSFAAIALSEAGGDILSVSRAMGRARPSITLDRYGHLAPAGLAPLMGSIDRLVRLETDGDSDDAA
ncbi:tyrosine-type recombinase/integrase [Paenarthrobacter sp. DKR-5]|uniref:tyrosine-type recombinase/integrase n=1 Tax=Paenarthrobacter sp. DKR-5 TaxID=2835535 RepID=UPI001BDD131F|nr:tyrosine-type recombinase/integrase [Paenarthrobacter sp. DKR-5]MBT1004330.1 tyrosine-type recombinase/integrase [Paenarthrobacter sp. DKR-5]